MEYSALSGLADSLKNGDALKPRIQSREETVPLVDYYSAWAASGDAHAPKYCKVSGSGSVEEIRDRVAAALIS